MSDLPQNKLDVPIRPVQRASRGRRRAAIAGIGIVAIVGGAIGLANLNRAVDTTAVAPTPRVSPGTSAGATPAPTDDATPQPVQELPILPNVALPDAPRPALLVRIGTGAELLAWTPGDDDLTLVRTFPGAYEPEADDQRVALSPDARFAISTIARPTGPVGQDLVRLVTEDGVTWEREGVTGNTGVAWWASERFALVGEASAMVLGEVDPAGQVTAREVAIDDAVVAAVSPVPSAGPGAESWFAPIGFAVDGRSVLAARFNEATRTIEPAFRLGFEDGVAQPLAAFPSAGPSGLLAGGSEFGFVDPVRGRSLRFPDFGSDEPAPFTVLEADGRVAFDVEARWLAGLSWDDAGRLAILDRTAPDGPSAFRLRSIDEDGAATVLFETPPLARATLIGVRNGYAGLALQVDEPQRTQLVLVAMDGSAVSGVETGAAGENGPDGAGWVP